MSIQNKLDQIALNIGSKQMQITITRKTLYGNQVFYPVCEQSKRLATLANTKTLTRDALKLIQEMGFDIQIQLPEVSI